MRRLFGILAIGALLVACSPAPSGVLPPEKMARLMADMEIGESVIESESGRYRSDSLKMVLRQSVYARHGVTSEDVDSSLAWYGGHLEHYSKVYDRVVEILEEKTAESRSAGTQLRAQVTVSEDADSADIWPFERALRFSAKSPTDFIRFVMSRDRNFEHGDIYQLKFKTQGQGTVSVAMAAEYVQPGTDYVYHNESYPGWHTVTLALDSVNNINRVFGTIGVKLRDNQTLYIDSLSLVRMRMKPGRTVSGSVKKKLHR